MSLSNKLSLNDVNFQNKKVIIRTDYNVPIKEDKILNSSRIDLTIPTIKYVLEQGAHCVTIISHLGRPNGHNVPELSLLPIYYYLQSLLNYNIVFISNGVSDDAVKSISNADKGTIFLLENVRFHPEEYGYTLSNNNEKINISDEDIKLYMERLNNLGDIFINEAFAISHRSPNSIAGIKLKYRIPGLLLSKEVNYINNTLNSPNRPFLAILGGTTICDKLQLIYNLIDIVDDIIIAGGMCFSFIKILYNIDIGSSLYDEQGSQVINKIITKAELKGVRLHFPIDFIIGDNLTNYSKTKVISIYDGINDGWMGLDIGPESIELFQQLIYDAKTILWNGPVGVYELKSFSTGSQILLHDVIENTIKGGISIIEGDDTINMVARLGDESGISHISTGNGAALHLLEGQQLPGVICLTDKQIN